MSDLEQLSSLLLFLDHVDQNTIEQEFTALRTQSVAWKKLHGSETGALKENIKKNRYKDILPYDDSRVLLSLRTSESDGDYINASFIQGPLSGGYIAAQAPLSSTLGDFWRMVWQYRIKVIVMACREFEMAKKKCEVYWSALNQTTSFGPFSIHCGESSPTQDLTVRELQVSFQKDVRMVTQLQFLSWPDHDVPHEASGVLDLLHRIQDLQQSSPDLLLRAQHPQNHNLKLVHCSAGCGRTGVICALDQIYQLLIHEKLTSDFNIMGIVMELRKQRPSAVQTKEQYRFIYTATSCLFRWFLQKNSSASVYTNLPRLKKPQKSVTAAASDNRSQQQKMDATYAVVNKKGTASQSPTLSRKADGTHSYDNVVAPTPIYSVVRPRAKPHTSDTHLYDLATPTSSDVKPHLISEASRSVSEVDDDYEDVTPSASDSSSLPPSNGIGFNKRVSKPRGPRDPPVQWRRLER